MNDIGGRLRHAREQRGLSLDDAARLTKLSSNVLRSIELNDFDRLPAGMYRKAYLRTVATEVGLDPLEIAADYETEFEAPAAAATRTTATAKAPDRWVELLQPSPHRTIVTLVAVATLLIAWFALQPAPESLSAGLDTQSPTESRPLPASLDEGQTIATADVPGGLRAATSVASSETLLKIDLTTTGWCWVAAESDGARVVYGLVEPGKRIVVEGHRRLLVRLGDAGSVRLSINGGPSRTPGANGEVVELDVTSGALQTSDDGAVETEST